MLRILAENEELILVHKPAGLSVQPGERAGRALVDIAEAQLGYRPHLIHRLDRETEGVLALAKDVAAARRWGKAMEGSEADKRYAAIVSGHVAPPEARLTAPIMVGGQAKPALTEYRLEGRYRLDLGQGPRPFSLLNLRLGSGRPHQIRIHLALSGWPILMDDRHGDFRVNKEAQRKLRLKHLMLVARSLSLGGLSAQLPWPEHFEAFFAAAEGDAT